jgi:hypothetical protein
MAPIGARIANRRSLKTNPLPQLRRPPFGAEDVLRGDSDHEYCRKIEADLTPTAGVDEQRCDKPPPLAPGNGVWISFEPGQ